MEHAVSSPTSTDAPLEYITVEAYQWPKPPRPQRTRMDEQERKRRHREGQRQFMLRKRSRVVELRRELELTKMRLNYLWALNEEKLLREDKERLDQLKTCPSGPVNSDELPFSVAVNGTDPLPASVLDSMLAEVLSSL